MKKKGGTKMNTAIKKPTTPAQSLEQSLKEMQLIRQGKIKGKPWKDLYKELQNDK